MSKTYKSNKSQLYKAAQRLKILTKNQISDNSDTATNIIFHVTNLPNTMMMIQKRLQ